MNFCEIGVGDIFEDQDPRMLRPTGRRRLEVIGFEESGESVRVIVRDTVTGLKTRIREDRLVKGGKRGYKQVKEAL